MTTPSEYLVVEDDVMLMHGNVQLDSQEEAEYAFEANGATYYMEVAQVPGHPGNDNPNAIVEGCGGFSEDFSLGFINQFPQNDYDPFVAIDCQQNIGSYDPNDKIGYPVGWTDENLIEVNEGIEYRVRFQNTGTDTAFKVVVLDTLSDHLDISTFRPGVASHPFQIDIEEGRVLKYTFDNIMLPDSNVNEPTSHGFFLFKIDQKKDNPLGTEILNSAAIYFDFNDPVITNQAYHKVGERLLVSVQQDPIPANLAAAKVFPNPFTETTQFELAQNTKLPLYFKLFDQQGRLLREEVHRSHQFPFRRTWLSAGLYFYQIRIEGQIRYSGKISIQ